MASVMKLTSSAAGKLIMRQGVLQPLRGAASGTASQVRFSLFLVTSLMKLKQRSGMPIKCDFSYLWICNMFEIVKN